MRITVINEERKLRSWKRIHCLSRYWSTLFWSRLARHGHRPKGDAQSSDTRISQEFSCTAYQGRYVSYHSTPDHWHTLTASCGWSERSQNCSVSIKEHPSSNCLKGKATLQLPCIRLCRRVKLNPAPFTKGSLQYRPRQEQQWQAEEPSWSNYGLLVPCRTLLLPQGEPFEAASLNVWSMELTVNKTAENGPSSTSSCCLHLQEKTADIQKASSILIKTFIVLKTRWKWGKEPA